MKYRGQRGLPRMLVLVSVLFVDGAFAQTPRSLSDLTGPWQLFVDDYTVQSKVGVARTYHAFQKYAGNPVMVADRAWEGDNIYVYGTVLPAESGSGYRMWYHSLSFTLPKTDRVHANYATSTDGIHWEKPNLGIISFNGSTDNNIFIVPGNCPSVMHTPWDAGVLGAYKIMRGVSSQFGGAWSSDALHWTEDPYAICPPASDVCTFNWDPHTQRYMGFPKMGAVVNGLSRRSTGVWATGDFESWPAPRLVLTPDSWDDRWGPNPAAMQGTHFYGLCGFAYESTYLGFLWILRATGKISGADDGPIFVELVSSHDGVHWLRQEGDRPPILPLGPDGAWDDGMVFTTTHPLVEGNTLRLYYGGFDGTHAQEGLWHAGIGMATLRKDGFASLDAGAAGGAVTTKRLVGASGPLHVNYAAIGGSLRVEVLDAGGAVVPGYGEADCVVLQGDEVDGVVTWASRTELPATGEPIRLRFVLQNASVYSFMAGAGAQILEEPASPPLAAVYDFENETGQTARDQCLDDGAQDALLEGDVRVSTNPALAAFGSHAAAFGYDTASMNTLTIPGTANLGTRFTLAAMVNSATGEYARIFGTPSVAWGAPVAALALDLDPSGLSTPGLRLTCKGMEISSQPLSVGGGQYHHVAVTYDDGEVTLYLDGASVGHGYVSGGDPVKLPGDVRIGPGVTAPGPASFIGYVDDVLVTGRALSAGEIASLAQQGAGAL
ncbi:MAG TPA: LamG domain-containing protein, partial [Phycisphaerae bacterium]|nr:LamG domain-containing protein [Phycisphaerae bacterium]